MTVVTAAWSSRYFFIKRYSYFRTAEQLNRASERKDQPADDTEHFSEVFNQHTGGAAQVKKRTNYTFIG